MDFDYVSGRFGVAVQRNDANSTPDPVVNTLGASLGFGFGADSSFVLEPALDIMWTNYEWMNGRAAPTPSESGGGNNIFVLAMLLDIPVYWNFPIGGRFSGSLGMGTAILMRASFPADKTPGYADEMKDNLSRAATYFWEAGRWFYPSAALRLSIWLQEGFSFALTGRAFYPLANLWNNEPALLDSSIIQVSLSVLVEL